MRKLDYLSLGKNNSTLLWFFRKWIYFWSLDCDRLSVLISLHLYFSGALHCLTLSCLLFLMLNLLSLLGSNKLRWPFFYVSLFVLNFWNFNLNYIFRKAILFIHSLDSREVWLFDRRYDWAVAELIIFKIANRGWWARLCQRLSWDDTFFIIHIVLNQHSFFLHIFYFFQCCFF